MIKSRLYLAASLGALMITSPALAETKGTIAQIGAPTADDANSIAIEQIASNNAFYSLNQGGARNLIDLTLADDNTNDGGVVINDKAYVQSIDVYQDVGSADNVFVATINSTNNAGSGGVTIVEQYGSNGQVFLDVKGDSQSASITQGAGAANSFANVTQGDDVNYSGRNSVVISQTGEFGESTADVTQSGSDNDTSITQQGQFNTAYVEQIGVSGGITITQGASSDTVLANVLQSGSGNSVSITQADLGEGTVEGAMAFVTQTNGDGNSATINQAGDFSIVRISQLNGGGDTAIVTASAGASGDVNSFVLVDQIGTSVVSNNSATITQYSDSLGASASLWQYGSGNIATIDQDGSSGNSVSSVQGSIEGDGIQSHNASLTVSQNGDTLYAETAQFGSDNSILLNQSGTGSTAYLTQDGSGNVMDVTQADDSQYADLYQSGNGNSITLAQTGGNNFADLSQIGDGNSLNVTQNGYNNTVGIVQLGDNYDLSLTQTNNYNQLYINYTPAP
jgi:hypothetical protein